MWCCTATASRKPILHALAALWKDPAATTHSKCRVRPLLAAAILGMMSRCSCTKVLLVRVSYVKIRNWIRHERTEVLIQQAWFSDYKLRAVTDRAYRGTRQISELLSAVHNGKNRHCSFQFVGATLPNSMEGQETSSLRLPLVGIKSGLLAPARSYRVWQVR